MKEFFHSTAAERQAAARALALAQQLQMRHFFHRRVVRRPAGERLLFLEAHPDDAAIGCAGTILRSVEDGAEVAVACLTDGRAAALHPAEQDEMAARRASEARQVAERLGIPPPRLLAWNETTFTNRQHRDALLDWLRELLRELRPDAVFVPYLADQHADHRYLCFLLAECLRSFSLDATVYGYQTWSFPPPGLVVDISAELDEKLDVLRLYASQLALLDYAAMAEQVARAHAPLAGPAATAAEVFCPFTRETFVDAVTLLDLGSPASLSVGVLLTPPG